MHYEQYALYCENAFLIQLVLRLRVLRLLRAGESFSQYTPLLLLSNEVPSIDNI